MKLCHKCNQVKKLDDFHKDKSRIDGLNHICKNCKKTYDIGRKCKHSIVTLKKKYKHKVELLNKKYIIDILLQYGFRRADITVQLIELKRNQIILKRTVNELQRNNRPISRC